MLINFEDAKLRLQFNRFRKNGSIPDVIYASEEPYLYSADLVHWAKMLLIIEENNNLIHIMSNLQTCYSIFKFPYIMNKYRKGMNPILSLYQELQRSKFNQQKDKFDKWIIKLCNDNNSKIIHAIECDIKSIKSHIIRYKKTEQNAPSLLKLHNKLCMCLEGFNKESL